MRAPPSLRGARCWQRPLLILVSCSVLTVGCVPLSVSYYRPEAAGGTIVPAVCPPSDQYIRIATDGVVVSAGVRQSPIEHQLSIYVDYEVSDGDVVTLKDSTVAIMDGDVVLASGPLTGFMWISRTKRAEVAGGSPMVGRPEGRLLWPRPPYHGKVENVFYSFTAVMPEPPVERFVLKLPGMTINDVQVVAPPILFTKNRKIALMPLNC
jgi:hypothetical protein